MVAERKREAAKGRGREKEKDKEQFIDSSFVSRCLKESSR
jgi:hypothetical protein